MVRSPATARTVLRSLAGLGRRPYAYPVDVDGTGRAPTLEGRRGYHTTPSGKTLVRYPSAYGWRTVYHASTYRVVVGREWLRAQALGSPGKLRSAALALL